MDAISIIGKVLTLIGALGLFLFGMKLMSESLQRVAGDRMRSILASMTSNRLKGVLTGFLITSTIQSSSATTVMIVSFVNAGLLSLIEAIGVIMGANIGTTVTAWIISILGFKISLSVLSLPIIGLSFPLFFSKNSNKKTWGEFLIGFAILFIGLQFLKESVPDIRSNPVALEFLANYTNMGMISVLIFVLIGTLLTVAIQSSSATMALTLVMCYNGLIPFEMAAAMVLGENIGTTVTANIAAVVANVSAKRAARAHLIFNVIGVIWILAIFYPFLRIIDWIVEENHSVSILNSNLTAGEFEGVKQILPIALAIFHTLFNILNTTFLIGFSKQIAKLATKLVPVKLEEDEEFRLKFINIGLLSTPELSLLQAKKEIGVFGKRIEKMFGKIPTLMAETNSKTYDLLLRKIEKHEQITDNMELEIASYLTSLSEGELSHSSSLRVRGMLKIIDDMESIGDVCYQMSKIIDNNNQAKVSLTDEQIENLNKMFDLVKESFRIMNENLGKETKYLNYQAAEEIEHKINDFRNELRQNHVDALKEKTYEFKSGAYYSDIFSLCEKTGDFVINVSESILEYNEAKK